MTRFAGLVEYDGTGFSGWAAQPGRRTVEGELAGALRTVLRQPVKLTVAGRTDAGVHASGQVVSFDVETGIDPGAIAYKASAVLREDAALRRCVAAPVGFDARGSAASRSYEYRVLNAPIRSPLEWGRAVHIPKDLDLGAMREAAGLVAGEHDFRAFTPTETRHIFFRRVVSESRWERRGELLVYHVTADAFLYGMVRALVGTMLEVGRGRREPSDFAHLINGAERREAGPAAPARGLTLVGVGYGDERDLWGGVS